MSNNTLPRVNYSEFVTAAQTNNIIYIDQFIGTHGKDVVLNTAGTMYDGLWQAAENTSLQTFKRFLDIGMSPNTCRTSVDVTDNVRREHLLERILRNAIVHRGAPISIRMAIELLRRGADPTANRGNGKYAFAHTAEIRNQELVREHINKGKNLSDDRPDTPRFREYFKLCELIELNRVKEIKNLARTLNYHIDFADLINMSPLRFATYRGIRSGS